MHIGPRQPIHFCFDSRSTMWTAFKNISKLTLLAFLLQWFYPFARLWLLVAGPLVYIGVVFALQWYTWYCHEQAELYGSGKKAVTKGNPSKTNRVLFSGPRASLAEMAYIGLSHTPMFLYMLFNVIVNRIIPFTWKYCQPGFRNTTITDKVIFDMITGSSLITIAKINETGDEISFRFPDDFDCKLVSGFNPAGLEIVLNIAEQRMERAEIKGEPLDKEYVMTSLIMASGMWIHTLIHLSSEKCAREIENKPSKLHEIKESSRFVTGLHDALLYFPLSPVFNSRFSNFYFKLEWQHLSL